MESKQYRRFEVKAAPDEGEGTFTGYASTWERDLDDDVIVKGAYERTLAEDYPDGGAHIPIHWQHKDGSPFDIVGETTSAVEDEQGLAVTGRIDTSTPEGAQVYKLMRAGLVHQMSVGFLARQTAFVEDEGAKYPWDGYREIRDIKLFEISIVQCAANQGCEVIEVKAGQAIAAAAVQKLRDAYEGLGDVLDGLDGGDGDEDEDGGSGPANDAGYGPGDGQSQDGEGEKSARAGEFKEIAEVFGGKSE